MPESPTRSDQPAPKGFDDNKTTGNNRAKDQSRRFDNNKSTGNNQSRNQSKEVDCAGKRRPPRAEPAQRVPAERCRQGTAHQRIQRPDEGQPEGRPPAHEDDTQRALRPPAVPPLRRVQRDDTMEATASRLESAGGTISSVANSQTERNGTSEVQAAHPNKLEDILCDPTAKAF